MEKYCRMGQATDDSMAHAHCIRHPRLQIHTIKVVKYSLLFHRNTGCTNAPQCYDIHVHILLVFLPFDCSACCLHYKKSWRPTNIDTCWVDQNVAII